MHKFIIHRAKLAEQARTWQCLTWFNLNSCSESKKMAESPLGSVTCIIRDRVSHESEFFNNFSLALHAENCIVSGEKRKMIAKHGSMTDNWRAEQLCALSASAGAEQLLCIGDSAINTEEVRPGRAELSRKFFPPFASGRWNCQKLENEKIWEANSFTSHSVRQLVQLQLNIFTQKKELFQHKFHPAESEKTS
jgi:hypothetical protein